MERAARYDERAGLVAGPDAGGRARVEARRRRIVLVEHLHVHVRRAARNLDVVDAAGKPHGVRSKPTSCGPGRPHPHRAAGNPQRADLDRIALRRIHHRIHPGRYEPARRIRRAASGGLGGRRQLDVVVPRNAVAVLVLVAVLADAAGKGRVHKPPGHAERAVALDALRAVAGQRETQHSACHGAGRRVLVKGEADGLLARKLAAQTSPGNGGDRVLRRHKHSVLLLGSGSRHRKKASDLRIVAADGRSAGVLDVAGHRQRNDSAGKREVAPRRYHARLLRALRRRRQRAAPVDGERRRIRRVDGGRSVGRYRILASQQKNGRLPAAQGESPRHHRVLQRHAECRLRRDGHVPADRAGNHEVRALLRRLVDSRRGYLDKVRVRVRPGRRRRKHGRERGRDFDCLCWSFHVESSFAILYSEEDST